jgi:hypothetical protein
MFYTIYKITNKLNGKIYIGKHQTRDLNDGYMGSGKLITCAIQKYGHENFEKKILFIFETEKEMNAKEAELVTEQFVKEDANYNLCTGGHGGWGYLNDSSKKHIERTSKAGKKGGPAASRKTKEIYGVNSTRSLSSTINKIRNTKLEKYGGVGFDIKERQGRAVEEFRRKYGVENPSQYPDIRAKIDQTYANNKHQQGISNSQFGTKWITNGIEERKIKKDEDIPVNWKRGRKQKGSNNGNTHTCT